MTSGTWNEKARNGGLLLRGSWFVSVAFFVCLTVPEIAHPEYLKAQKVSP